MKTPSLHTSLNLISGAIGFALLVAVGVGAYSQRAQMLHDRQESLERIVEVAGKVVDSEERAVSSGTKTIEQAQRDAKQRLADMTYENNGYVGAVDDQVRLLVHPNPKLIGQNMADYRDSNNVAAFQEIAHNAQASGTAVVKYRFAKPGGTEEFEKITAVRYNSGWRWAIFSGLYVDDIDNVFYSVLLRDGSILLVLIIAAMLALSQLVSRGILKPIDLVVESCERVATGDLTKVIQGGGSGEIGRLMNALATMQIELIQIVRTARDIGTTIATSAGTLADGSTHLSERTVSSAAALEQTSATIGQISSTVSHTADNSQAASSVAKNASMIAHQGWQIMQQMVTSMHGVAEKSKKIEEITAVIDGIAFQTNILALNAAVEAARAGEAGRGFAVVASEVRTLAQRSATAAREIKGLIDTSVDEITHSSGLAEEAGGTIKEVVKSVEELTKLVSDFATASVEQSDAIRQIYQAVSELDRTTQENAALVDQSAEASRELDGQSARLVEAMATYKLDTDRRERERRRSLAVLERPALSAG